MNNFRHITAMALTLAALSAPVWAQDTTSSTPSSTPSTSSSTTGQNSTSISISGGSSGVSGDDFYNRMSGRDKYRYSWVFNNLDQREVRRYKAQGFSDADIKAAANIAMASELPIPYVLSQYRVSGAPLPVVAGMLGVPRTNLSADIPGYGMSGAEMSMAISGTSGLSGMSSSGMSSGNSTGTGTGSGTTTSPSTGGGTTTTR